MIGQHGDLVLDGLEDKMGLGGRHARDALDGTMNLLEAGRRVGDDLEQEVKLTGQIVALGNVGMTANHIDQIIIVFGVFQTDFHQRGQVVADLLGVDEYGVLSDDASGLHASDAFDDR